MSELSKRAIALHYKVIIDNEYWWLYSVEFKSLDDKTYSTYLYARDDYHAQLLLEDLKNGATICGRLE